MLGLDLYKDMIKLLNKVEPVMALFLACVFVVTYFIMLLLSFSKVRDRITGFLFWDYIFRHVDKDDIDLLIEKLTFARDNNIDFKEYIKPPKEEHFEPHLKRVK